jgi:hypothetical protein
MTNEEKYRRELNALRRACCSMPIPTRGTFRKSLEESDPEAATALATATKGVQTLTRPLQAGDPALVKRLREFVQNRGEARNGIVNGAIGVPVYEYRGTVVRIACDRRNLSMEVRLVENDNPVLCVNEAGKIIRTHGEFCYVEEIIADYLGVDLP